MIDCNKCIHFRLCKYGDSKHSSCGFYVEDRHHGEMDIKNLKKGDYVLVKCKVEAVFVMGGMVMVTTRDCNEGFDAYIDEIEGAEE